VITDAVVKKVGEAQFPTYFRAGEYGEGIYQALEDLYAYILADPEIMALYADAGGETTSQA